MVKPQEQIHKSCVLPLCGHLKQLLPFSPRARHCAGITENKEMRNREIKIFSYLMCVCVCVCVSGLRLRVRLWEPQSKASHESNIWVWGSVA